MVGVEVCILYKPSTYTNLRQPHSYSDFRPGCSDPDPDPGLTLTLTLNLTLKTVWSDFRQLQASGCGRLAALAQRSLKNPLTEWELSNLR